MSADKNLGPAIIERRKYIQSMLEQHLLKPIYYKQIPNTIIQQQLEIQ